MRRRVDAELFVSGFGAEFVVASAKVLYERRSSDDHRCRAAGFEAAHRPEPRFESTVVARYPLGSRRRGDDVSWQISEPWSQVCERRNGARTS